MVSQGAAKNRQRITRSELVAIQEKNSDHPDRAGIIGAYQAPKWSYDSVPVSLY